MNGPCKAKLGSEAGYSLPNITIELAAYTAFGFQRDPINCSHGVRSARQLMAPFAVDIDMEIKEATPGDAEVLAGIIRQGFRDVADRLALTQENCPKHPSNYTAEWIASDLQRGVRYYLLECRGEAVGCVALEMATDDLFYLERLAVLPCHRRQGFGTTLVRHGLAQAKTAGARKVSVGITADHVELKAWYRGLGFVEEGIKEFAHLPFRVAFLIRTL